MNHPTTSALTVTNVVLGAIVALMILSFLGGIVWELFSKLRRRRTILKNIDNELHHLFQDRQ